jgi:hypothetical protein
MRLKRLEVLEGWLAAPPADFVCDFNVQPHLADAAYDLVPLSEELTKNIK